MLRVLATLSILFPAAAQAASLKPMSMLSDGVVRLSDLFEDVGTDRVLGPAPAPGTRIVVEAAQLAAIARQFGIAWRPASAGDRAILERPGRPMPTAEIHAVLRAALRSAGTAEDVELDIPALAPPILPLNTPARPDVTQLAYDSASGQFAATLLVTGTGFSPIHLRVAGRTREMASLAVPVRRIQAGEALRSDDLRLARVRAETIRGDVARTIADAIGQAPRRPLAAGQAVPLADLARPAVMHKGRPVMLRLESPGLALATQGQALEDAAPGARIRVLNPGTRSILEATVLDGENARVVPGAMPVPADPITLARAR